MRDSRPCLQKLMSRCTGVDGGLGKSSCVPYPSPAYHSAHAKGCRSARPPPAVFVSSSGLSAGLANVQMELCNSMAPGGSIERWASDVVDLSGVLRVATNLLCSPGSSIRLSDIPGMIDGTASPRVMNTVQAAKLLVTVGCQVHTLGPM